MCYQDTDLTSPGFFALTQLGRYKKSHFYQTLNVHWENHLPLFGFSGTEKKREIFVPFLTQGLCIGHPDSFILAPQFGAIARSRSAHLQVPRRTCAHTYAHLPQNTSHLEE